MRSEKGWRRVRFAGTARGGGDFVEVVEAADEFVDGGFVGLDLAFAAFAAFAAFVLALAEGGALGGGFLASIIWRTRSLIRSVLRRSAAVSASVRQVLDFRARMTS